jgi:hypothetical protein
MMLRVEETHISIPSGTCVAQERRAWMAVQSR